MLQELQARPPYLPPGAGNIQQFRMRTMAGCLPACQRIEWNGAARKELKGEGVVGENKVSPATAVAVTVVVAVVVLIQERRY